MQTKLLPQPLHLVLYLIASSGKPKKGSCTFSEESSFALVSCVALTAWANEEGLHVLDNF